MLRQNGFIRSCIKAIFLPSMIGRRLLEEEKTLDKMSMNRKEEEVEKKNFTLTI